MSSSDRSSAALSWASAACGSSPVVVAGRGLARALVAVVLLAVLVRGVRLRLLGERVAQAEIGHQLPHPAGEGVLVGGLGVELGQDLLDLAVEPVAPSVELLCLRLAQAVSLQPLAHVELDDLGDGRILAGRRVAGRTRLGRPAAKQLLEIGPHAGHVATAHELDPKLLEPVEQQPCHLAVRHHPAMQRAVVITAAQRLTVGLAAHPGDLACRHVLARRGDADDRLARFLAGSRGPAAVAGLEAELELRLFGDGSRRRP
jgi:hypothetical protein